MELFYNGSWSNCFAVWDGQRATVVDKTGKYSRHSHFVQEVKRHAPEGCKVFSRKRVCEVMRNA